MEEHPKEAVGALPEMWVWLPGKAREVWSGQGKRKGRRAPLGDVTSLGSWGDRHGLRYPRQQGARKAAEFLAEMTFKRKEHYFSDLQLGSSIKL